MSRAFFEDFGSTPVPEPEPARPVIDADALRESYEAGYQAGQQNGVVGAEAEKAKRTADIAQAFEESGFSYFEARQHVLNSMRPLLETIFETILPDMAQDGLSNLAIEELVKLASQIDTPIKLACSPDVLVEIKTISDEHINFPLEICSDPKLTSKQIELQYDRGTSRIDIDQTIAQMRRMSANFFEQLTQETAQDG